MIIKFILMFLSIIIPWNLRRIVLQKCFGFKIDPTSRIGFSWVFPRVLILEKNARIGNFTICKNLEKLHLKNSASIGKANWITGYTSTISPHFKEQKNRKSQLIIKEHSAITNRHLIDCTNSVIIGKFSTIAGYRSQILTHSINLEICKQWSEPIKIGDYCFIGTNSVLLGGSTLPSHSVLGAKSLLNKSYSEEFYLFTGVPAIPKEKLSPSLKYFSRSKGYVI